jgi:hypothetical protein
VFPAHQGPATDQEPPVSGSYHPSTRWKRGGGGASLCHYLALKLLIFGLSSSLQAKTRSNNWVAVQPKGGGEGGGST